MFKRFVARLLIILQIYNTLFQGVAHANLVAHYPVRDEIYLHTSPSKDGALRIALGTNRYGDAIGEELLDVIEVPAYDTLKKALRSPQLSPRVLRKAPIVDVSVDLSADAVASQPDQEQPALGLKTEPLVKPSQALDVDPDSDPELDVAPLFSKSGVTRAPEGVHFTLQGLEIFINNTGEALIQGTQTDFSKPIFLNWGGVVILNDVHAKALQIAAPRIVGRGKSTIEALVLEGSSHDGSATFINSGSLTAKELFLKNLISTNNGSLSAPHLLVDGQLKSQGSLTSDELLVAENGTLKLDAAATTTLTKVFLEKGGHLENHSTSQTAIEVLHSRGGILTSHGPLMVTEVAAESAFQAIYSRDTLSVDRGDIQTQRLENAGSFTAVTSALQVLAGRNQHGLKAKTLVIDEEFANEASGGLVTEAISGTGHFHNLGKIETEATFGVAIKRFSNSGLVKAQSVIGWIPNVFSSVSLLGLEQLDNTEDGVIEASAGISFTAATQVNNFGKLQTEDMALYSDKTLQKGDLIARTLNLIGQAFLNQGEITVEHLTAENGLINQASLITSASTDFGAGGLANAVKAKARLKSLGLSCDGSATPPCH